MQQTNYLDLDDLLVSRFDLANFYSQLQVALGQTALSFSGEGVQVTPDFLNPFVVNLSGASLGGTVDAGLAYDANGMLVVAPANANPFVIPTADAVNPRKDLLCIFYNQVGSSPIPKPTDPLTTIFQFLNDSFTIIVRKGVAAGVPVYPAKQAGDVILCGLNVPANALLGTTCTIDLTVREQGFIPSDKIGLNSAAFLLERSPGFQAYLTFLDAFVAAGAASVGDSGAKHDNGIVTINSAGVNGDTITIAGTTFTVGAGAGQIPVQANEVAMAYALARAIRDSALNTLYTAAAGLNFVGIIGRPAAPVGGALAVTGTTFSISGAVLAGNGPRTTATAPTVKQQIDQLDARAGNSLQVTAGNYTAKQTDKVILLTGIANILTLPAATTPDMMLFVKNVTNAGQQQIVCSGTDTIQENAVQGADTSINLVPGRSVMLVPDGVSAWQVFFG